MTRRSTLALALALTGAALPARAEPLPALLAVLTACTTPDITHADRMTALDAAGATPLEGDARLQAARAMRVGWVLLDPVAGGTVTPADLPALFADAEATAAREAAAEADGISIPTLDWRSLDGGTVAVQVFQTGRTRSTCVITAPAVDIADLAATWPTLADLPARTGPLGTVTALQAHPDTNNHFVEVFQPDAAAIATAWAGPVPATFIRLFNIPTAKAP